jgi:hypothetical protein
MRKISPIVLSLLLTLLMIPVFTPTPAPAAHKHVQKMQDLHHKLKVKKAKKKGMKAAQGGHGLLHKK